MVEVGGVRGGPVGPQPSPQVTTINSKDLFMRKCDKSSMTQPCFYVSFFMQMKIMCLKRMYNR